METIAMQQLAVGYPARRRAPHVVAGDLTATLQAGQLTCLLGANGAGKSTLLRTLCGQQPPLRGRLVLMGQEADTLSQGGWARLVSVVLTARPEATRLTVAELVAMGRMPYTNMWGTLRAADRAAVARAMRLVCIGGLASRPIATLSDGERQKAMIAKALAQDTPIVMLDEPTAFLDYPAKVDTLQMLLRLAHDEGKTILLSTHDLELALQAADNLWLLLAGEGLHAGTPAQLAAEGALSCFVDRPDLHLNPDTLTVQVLKKVQE